VRETEGTTTLFTQHYDLNPDGTRHAARALLSANCAESNGTRLVPKKH
jgi:hypothetical protein